eukprot:828833-Amorphochlora_amoeboformis.AAC.1
MGTVLVSRSVNGVGPFARTASPATWRNVTMACLKLHATLFARCSEPIKNDDVKKAYYEVIKSTEKKDELISRIKERM